MSPNANHNPLHYPPSFDPHHTSSRYPSNPGHAHSHSRSYSHSSSHSHRTAAAPQGTYSVYSPYRPGEYGRSERGVMMGDRTGTGTGTGVERKLFVEGDEVQEEEGGWRGHRASSPLAPAFEPKMVLRNGASIDLISWLRTNFIHSPPPHNAITPPMPLNGIRHLLLERFPRAPEVSEIHKAVLAAFPHSQWDYAENNSEPPSMRGLKWAGRDVEEDYELEEGYEARYREGGANGAVDGAAGQGQLTRGRMSNGNGTKQSRSPTQSTLVSPISSSKRPLPDTPARSVLEEFAEIATLTGKTPGSRTKSLPSETLAASPDSADLATAEDGLLLKGKKRVATDSPERSGSGSGSGGHQRRASSSDKLHGLLAAAEAVEGSPLTTILPPNATASASANAHKRRRTIGGSGPAREMMAFPRRALSARGTMSPPPVNGMGHGQRGSGSGSGNGNGLRQVEENVDYVVPLNDTAFAAPASASSSSSALPGPLSANGHGNGNPTSSSSTATPSRANRKFNELPTDGDRPGFDCKPPYPYHEMIRHAIEQAPDRRLQLNQIYASIAERFPFFKTLDEKKTAGWQNSIRHNLSLKKMFVRVNKIDGIPDDTAGKGGWWTVIPGVPDEGRPGRKAKARKAKELAARQLLIDKQAAEEAKGLDEARARDRGGERDVRDGPEPSPAELARMDRERMMDMDMELQREHELRQREKREREAREAMAWVEQQDRAEMVERERRRKEGKENEPLLAGGGGRVPMGEAPREYVAGDKRPEGWMGGMNGWA
ncbi:hypothetical protein B9479_007664 [Cryptococcus floricola]|uniref:Fork-head domain-containing protein n=1 Tax=Cryptococcus floricola TaxID=2591691 RepID=A0A5D3ALC6_9TREE|nr:hypothetical protein B9479_007664 [Cryptococcus floricola]